MKKKRYSIYHVNAIVSRNCGIKEQDSFSFLIGNMFDVSTQIVKEFEKQIKLYNEFCPNDYFICKYENLEIEKVGEFWL